MPVRVLQPCALLHPELGTHVVPPLSAYYDDDDPLVVAHPEAFGTDEEILELKNAPAVEGVTIEQASAAPGEKRRARR